MNREYNPKLKELRKYFINSKNKKECLNIFSKILQDGIEFKTNSKNDKSVLKYKEQEKIMKDLLEPMPIKSKDIRKVIKECKKKIIDGSVNFSSEDFLAFPDSGNSTAAMCGHLLYGMLNQNMINSIHCSPTATFVEIAVINWLRDIIGYKVRKKQRDIIDVGGINVPGGTLANTVALLLARERIMPKTMQKGLIRTNKPLKMFIPEGIGHYTSKAAMGWLGIGTENIVEVKTTKDFTIDKGDLVDKIKYYRKNSIPFVIVAYAGDSRTMAIDDFVGLSKIAKKYKIWFHIDACHGASLCFSDKLKYKIKGINLADSVTLDPHKVLFTPYNLSYLLIKNPKDFKPIAGVSDLITMEKYSFGQITPFLGSRSFNSLKLWFLIKNLGKKNIGYLIEKRHEMAKHFASLVEKENDFYLMNNVIINSVAYIYIPKELKEKLDENPSRKHIDLINELNLRIQKKMFREGQFYVHTFKLNDFKNILGTGSNEVYQMQRLMLGNPLTAKGNLKNLLEYSKKIAEEEWRKLKRTSKK